MIGMEGCCSNCGEEGTIDDEGICKDCHMVFLAPEGEVEA